MPKTISLRLDQTKLQIISYVSLTFFGYLCIGLPLAILPIFIHKNLGYSEIIAGIIISLQYIATFLVRGLAGKMVDTKGPKLAVLISMSSFLISGILLFVAFQFEEARMISLILLAVTRLITGCAEGMIGASPINWAMLVAGNEHTAIAISYNGIACYGALAVGAPLGVILSKNLGMEHIAFAIVIAALLGLVYSSFLKPAYGNSTSEPIPFLKVLKLVTPFGICLGLAGLGFGGLSNFITLYYDYFNWNNAALCLSVFSSLFILGRMLFSNQINAKGGLNVALICLITEAIGLFLLFLAPNESLALIGAAIAGLGFSLVFPALGVEAVKLAPASNAGAALACYGLFIDLSLGATGLLEGTVINVFGMKYLFLFCAIMVVVGILIVIRLMNKKQTVIS